MPALETEDREAASTLPVLSLRLWLRWKGASVSRWSVGCGFRWNPTEELVGPLQDCERDENELSTRTRI